MLSSFSHTRPFATPWAVTRQAPLPMALSGQNTGVGCHFLLQRISPTQGLNPHLLRSPALAGWLFTSNTTWEAQGLLPGSIICSDFLKPCRDLLRWETPREGSDPLLLGQIWRSSLIFRLTCCLISFPSLPIQDCTGEVSKCFEEHSSFIFPCPYALQVTEVLKDCQNKI